MNDPRELPKMTRRRAVSSIATLSAAGAVTSLLPVAHAQSSPHVPTLADLQPFRVGTSNAWHNVPWYYGTDDHWEEESMGGLVLYKDMDIAVPTGTPPANGWPVIVHFHATGTTKSVTNTGPIGMYVRTPALTNPDQKFAFISVEFRHPVSNSYITPIPHQDTGFAIQYIRSLHSALNLDKNNVFALCRSRGNLGLWQTLQADMLDANAPTYEGRQSSLLKGIWSMSGQVTYRPHEWADLFIVEADRQTWIDSQESHTDAEWGSAIQSLLVAPSSQVPDIVMQHELPYYNRLLNITTDKDCDDCELWVNDKHFPDNGRVMRDAYRSKGYGDRILTIDAIDNANAESSLIDCVPWIQTLMSGARAVEAWAIAKSKTRGHLLYYARTPNDSKLGVWTNATGTTGTVPVVGGQIGKVVDGANGLANRANYSGVGTPALQDSSNNKPLLAQFSNGKYGILFEANDRLVISLANQNSTQSCFSWTDTGQYIVPALATSAYIMIGQSNMANQIMSLCVVNAGTNAITDNELKGYRQFANRIAGTNHV